MDGGESVVSVDDWSSDERRPLCHKLRVTDTCVDTK